MIYQVNSQLMLYLKFNLYKTTNHFIVLNGWTINYHFQQTKLNRHHFEWFGKTETLKCKKVNDFLDVYHNCILKSAASF